MLFALPTFFGALLLFVVEPLLAKWLLPTLGGNPATWAACMATFQGLLLAGYGYAHLSTRLSAGRSQATLHALLVAAAGVTAFAARSPGPPELGGLPPAIAVPWLLLRVAGLPFVMLAATAPLLQRWAAATWQRSPHSLYAVSNAGALVGLLGYPFAVEPFLGVDAQLWWWSAAFLGFGAAMITVCVRVGQALPDPAREAPSMGEADPAPRPATELRWLGYAFIPSAMLLAATNHITVDIAATPLLWVVPLALYLASFIVAFGGWRPSFRGPTLALWALGALGLGVNGFAQAGAPLARQLGATLVALLGCCLLCHGELALARPSAAWLTRYYLVIALGGALGGVFVSLVAPVVFADYYELELVAVGTFWVLFVASRAPESGAWPRLHRAALLLGAGLCLPLLATNVVVRMQGESPQGRVVERRRSFLGPLRVVDLPEGRILTHGRIQHGMQLRDATQRRSPTMYFGPGTGLALAMERHLPDRARRIGVVGLGIGTIATYGRAEDALRFYELDANVADVARHDFTFLADSAAHIDIVMGDGRLSLAREAPQAFDLLVLDAFSSDSVPVHLLTTEAFSVYLRHLATDGLLLANVSNRYLAVERVVRASARAHGLSCVVIETQTDAVRHVSHVAWALMARDPGALEAVAHGVPLVAATTPDVLWTDDRASLLALIR